MPGTPGIACLCSLSFLNDFRSFLDDIVEVVHNADMPDAIALSPTRLCVEVLGRALRPDAEGPRLVTGRSDFTRAARMGVVPRRVVCRFCLRGCVILGW